MLTYFKEDRSNMAKIRVDIDELMAKLDEVKCDDYASVELEISEDEDDTEDGKELMISAVTFDEDEPIGYGVVGELLDDMF